MLYNENKSTLDYFIDNIDDKNMQATLRYLQVKDNMIKEYNRKREKEQMKQDIIEDVLSYISIMIENGEAIQKINGLNNAIIQLGK